MRCDVLPRGESYAPAMLVVDDHAVARRAFVRILEEAGYLAVEVSSGREALRAIEDRFFDLMIIDLSMPDMDGFELLRAVHASLPKLKILAISGYLEGKMLKVARRLGAAATLEKTSAHALLIDTVCSLLSGTAA